MTRSREAYKFSEEGCLIDDACGWRMVPRIIKLAHAMGYEHDATERAWQSDYSDEEWERLEVIADEAIEWLHESRCARGFGVYWIAGGLYVLDVTKPFEG